MVELAIITSRHDHRWTDDELKKLLAMWLNGDDLTVIANAFGITHYAVNKQIHRMRTNGIPVPRRSPGNRAGRYNQLWTQEEVEYIVRRRNERATAESIADDLGRSFAAVQAMIQRMSKEGVSIRKFGGGKRRLWSSERLRDAIVGRGLRVVEADE